MNNLSASLAGVVIVLCSTVLVAADPSPTFLSPEEAGPDFGIQGEYEGTIGTATKLGVQVIALGDGKFDAVLYAQGLPGAGWEEKTKVLLTGETADGAVQLTGKNITAKISDGLISGTAEGDVAFEAKKVTRESPTLGASPPAGAVVLFDGSHVDHWQEGRMSEDHLLEVGTRTTESFRDFTLHLEFRTPFMPFARGQARGNSGMYLLDQYECQILDSFGLSGEDNECGGIYKISKPRLNMCLPPLSWQTYDVEFRAARFDENDMKVSSAVTTIRLNGVVIHENLTLPQATAGGGRNDEKPGALYLQNHRNPVHFRNIWIVEK